MGIELEADFHIGVALGEKLDGIHDLLNRKEPHPNYLKLARSAILQPLADSPAAVLNFGRPPANKIWNVLGMVTYAGDIATSIAAGTSSLFIGTDDGEPPLSLMNLIYTAIGVPNAKTFSKDVIWCYPGENVLVEITPDDSADPAPVGANIFVNEWNIKDKW